MEIQQSNGQKKPQVGSKTFCILLTACITLAMTLLLVYFCNGGVVFIPATQFGKASDYLVLGEVAKHIQDDFYGQIPSTEKLVDSAARAMVNELHDPYAHYFTSSEFDEYYKTIDGSYSGLGILISNPDSVGAKISSVYPSSPAEAAGLLANDIVTHINGENISGYTSEQFSPMLQGTDGKTVKLTILRDTQTLDITVTYGTVVVQNVHSKMIGKTGYILLDIFAETATQEFIEALDDLKAKGMTALVVDLRNNPGGSLTVVIDITDTILNQGTIVSIGRSMDDADLETYTASNGGISLPIAVLVNGNSASASEIFAAAIQDNNVGTIVGKTTYGKGIVQTTMPLSSADAWLKLTTDAYFTPSGRSIHGIGITPNIDVTLPTNLKDVAIGDLPEAQDTQLQEALKYLQGQLDANA